MEGLSKYWNTICVLFGIIGGFVVHILGGLDAILVTLIWAMVLDYITGLLKAIYTRKVSSRIGSKGIVKKIMILILVSLSYAIQLCVGLESGIREIVIMFFIGNEGISLLENAAVMLPIPKKLTDILEQLRSEGESSEEDTVNVGGNENE